MRMLILILGLVMLLMGGVWFGLRDKDKSVVLQQPTTSIQEPQEEPEREKSKPEIVSNQSEIATSPSSLPTGRQARNDEEQSIVSIQYSVPFTSQAPTGEWGKSAFQDGCEEASTLMVWMARTGTKLTRGEVRTKLIDMAEFQEKKIGHGVDTDGITTDTILLKEYFGITDSELIAYDFTLTELKLALQKGLVIVPTNGRALKNPNFTAPGPLQHMLVITGYNAETKEFITNDPGTRKGEGYRYPEQVLYDAIREYPTGKHLTIQTERKVMIVVPFEEKA